jgi:hypothetical protein
MLCTMKMLDNFYIRMLRSTIQTCESIAFWKVHKTECLIVAASRLHKIFVVTEKSISFLFSKLFVSCKELVCVFDFIQQAFFCLISVSIITLLYITSNEETLKINLLNDNVTD